MNLFCYTNCISYLIELLKLLRCDFIENIDFSILKSGNPNGGLSKIDYIVTLDMAKELCMIETNSKGKEYRKYFIDIEKIKISL